MEQIERMARYKLNVFHFHFTDNPGWRLESKLYPKVTDSSSMSRNPGKFYTQRELRDLVKFCRQREITLIPEMDMPGHTHEPANIEWSQEELERLKSAGRSADAHDGESHAGLGCGSFPRRCGGGFFGSA